MRAMEILVEMPQLVDATDFNMMDSLTNRQLTDRLLKSSREIIREDDRMMLFRTGKKDGSYALLNKLTGKIDYWVRYQEMTKRLIGQSVTQVILWRDRTSPLTDGITREIFNGHLLRNWPTIMSDAQQTKDGRDFWIARMATAHGQGYRVGMANLLEHRIEWCEGDVQEWLREQMSLWGDTEKFQGYRFLISRV